MGNENDVIIGSAVQGRFDHREIRLEENGWFFLEAAAILCSSKSTHCIHSAQVNTANLEALPLQSSSSKRSKFPGLWPNKLCGGMHNSLNHILFITFLLLLLLQISILITVNTWNPQTSLSTCFLQLITTSRLPSTVKLLSAGSIQCTHTADVVWLKLADNHRQSPATDQLRVFDDGNALKWDAVCGWMDSSWSSEQRATAYCLKLHSHSSPSVANCRPFQDVCAWLL